MAKKKHYRIREVAPQGRMTIVSLGIFKSTSESGAVKQAKKFKTSKRSPLEVKEIKEKNISRYPYDIVRGKKKRRR